MVTGIQKSAAGMLHGIRIILPFPGFVIVEIL
jgi:hypothetical protein